MFVVDTSVSMAQVANGMNILDCAKAVIEHFVKVRMRLQQTSQAGGARADRYFLVTTDESIDAIKVHFWSFVVAQPQYWCLCIFQSSCKER